MKEKTPYVALIFDLKKTPKYSAAHSSGIKRFDGYKKEYSNRRWALYCSCGECNELHNLTVINKDSYNIVFDRQVICKNCNKIYDQNSKTRLIAAKEPKRNVVSKRFGAVEKYKFFALYSFYTRVFVSVTTKKILLKDSGDYSLYVSKNTKAVRIKNKETITTIPFKYLVKHCSLLIDDMTVNVLYEDRISQRQFENEFINPLFKFCNFIESKCDNRDVKNILNLLDKERQDVYNNLLFKNSEQSYKNYYDLFFEGVCSYDVDAFNLCTENVSPHRYIWIQYFKQRLSIMLAIYMYSPIATIALSYGCDKLLHLLTNSSLMCSLTDLIRKKPTNPKDILETLFKKKIMSEFHKNKRIVIYQKKEIKKQKRKIRAKDPNELNKVKHINYKFINHPTLSVDHRIASVIKNDLKIKLKNLQFKKIYVDLFLKRFDAAAEFFYNLIGNTSSFDSIETVNKLLSNKLNKENYELLFSIQNWYIQNYHRINRKFRLDYKLSCHILKLYENKVPDDKIHTLQNLLHLYGDTITMLSEMEFEILEILKVKNISELDELHTSLTKSYRLIKDKKLIENLEKQILFYRHTECVLNNIKFTLIDSPEKFHEESNLMNHCVKTYCLSVSEGRFIIYSIEDLVTKERATLSISISNLNENKSYSFNQLKSKNNNKATSSIIEATLSFIKKFFKIKNTDAYDLTKNEITKPVTFEDEFLNEILLDAEDIQAENVNQNLGRINLEF